METIDISNEVASRTYPDRRRLKWLVGENAYTLEWWLDDLTWLASAVIPWPCPSYPTHADAYREAKRRFWADNEWPIRESAGAACGFRLFGMMPPCVLPTGHAGDHADGFGGHYGAGGGQ